MSTEFLREKDRLTAKVDQRIQVIFYGRQPHVDRYQSFVIIEITQAFEEAGFMRSDNHCLRRFAHIISKAKFGPDLMFGAGIS
ncbi:hypothetical protein DFR47_103552 [Pseudochrobactrum asaccharolyticum]|jgi:hypothetical protein|uniref:Uncharacterized protein n=1 Tax=Pseudochrobactrum asaccharolyticum TaxID=354351 RepID=A0A366E103_9HYPH|nr:hypothetical protein DFR47_103552 [Pseudochrobactrum asaccharolyticum]